MMSARLIIGFTFFLFSIISCQKEYEPIPTEMNVIDTGYVHLTPDQQGGCLYPYEYFIIDATSDSAVVYEWESDQSNNPVMVVNEPGLYRVEITFVNGSANTLSFSLGACIPQVFVPNSFSPVGNGLNDEWFPTTFNIESIHWQIRNKDGLLIYEADDDNDKWDGRLPNGNPAPRAFYMYYINYSTLTEENIILTGTIELIR